MSTPFPGAAISGLPVAVNIDGSEYSPVLQNGTTKRYQLNQLQGIINGPAGGLRLENFGMSTSATDAANTAAFQAGLNVGGLLWLTTPGTYGINAELLIGSYTDLRLGPGVIIQRKADNINLLQTSSFYVTPTTVTLSWGGIVEVTMTWTNHGRTVGDPICVQGADQSCYNGVFLVQQIVDANTLTFNIIRLPVTAPTGTIKARLCVRNIFISGGIWDYNSPTFARTELKSTPFFIAYIYNYAIRDVQTKNTIVFVVNCGAQRLGLIHNITTDTKSFGAAIQVYGPAFGIDVSHVDGRGGDDAVAFITKEYDIYVAYRWTFGDVLGCSAREIYSDNQTSGNTVGIYFSDQAYMDNIHLEGIYGAQSGTGIGVAGGLVYLNATINDTDRAGLITIERISGYSTLPAVRLDRGIIERLVIKDLVLDGQATPFDVISNRSVLTVNPATQINSLEIDGFSVHSTETGWSLANGYWFLAIAGNGVGLGGSVIKHLSLKNINVPVQSNLRLVGTSSGATINEIDIEGCFLNTTDGVVDIQAGILGSPHISIRNCNITADYGVAMASNGSVVINDNILNGFASGVITSGGSINVDVYGNGNTTVTGITTYFGVFSGSPAYNIHSTNFLVDTSLTRFGQTAGDIEYDGALFYKTPATASGRGVDLVEHFRSLYNTFTAVSSNAAQPWFDSPTGITLAASTSYFFEGELFLANGTTSHSTAILFALSGGLTLIDMSYSAIFTPAQNNVPTASTLTWVQTENAVTVGAASIVAGAHIKVAGIVRTSVSGKFTPQFQWSANPTGTNQVLFNTWFRIRPAGINTITYQGAWS